MRTTHADVVLELARTRSYFSIDDAAAVGVPRVVLTRLVRSGQLQRVSRGLYRHHLSPKTAHTDLVKIAHRSGQGVLCLLTALHFYGLAASPAKEIWLALPKNVEPPKLDCPRVQIIRFSRQAFAEGIETHCVDGFPVRLYSLQKTLVDCFKYRDKVGLNVALEALKRAWTRHLVGIDELFHYARICGVEDAMRPYIESLIWLKQEPKSQ